MNARSCWCFLAIASAAHAQAIGTRARDAAPEVVTMLKNKLKAEEEGVPTARQIDRNTQQIRNDNAEIKEQMDRALQSLRLVMEEQTHIRTELAQKDMSRVAVLERRLDDTAAEHREEVRLQQHDHDLWMSWLRSLAGGIFLTVILGWIKSRKLFKAITLVKHQTNGMSARMEDLAEQKGFWEGVAKGKRTAPES